MSLNCRYWGDEAAGRTFDIAVEDQIIATQDLNKNMPGHFFDVEYLIPQSLTKGEKRGDGAISGPCEQHRRRIVCLPDAQTLNQKNPGEYSPHENPVKTCSSARHGPGLPHKRFGFQRVGQVFRQSGGCLGPAGRQCAGGNLSVFFA